MLEPRPSVVRFVKTIARAESVRAAGGQGMHPAQSILFRLHQELGKLIGSDGFDVLLARSLVLARRAHADLAGITRGPGGQLEGLDRLAPAATGRDDAALAIVTHFIELLVTLIGEDLTMRMVRDPWPAIPDTEKQ